MLLFLWFVLSGGSELADLPGQRGADPGGEECRAGK
jgi:hypothetical protein